jgi:hypothetical protein
MSINHLLPEHVSFGPDEVKVLLTVFDAALRELIGKEDHADCQSTHPERAGYLRNKTPDLTLTDVKARQASKIREIGEALITTGFISLDAQAKILGLPRSTAWTILSAEHKGTGLSARIICRMLSSEPLPPLVRAKIIEYANEKAAGIYGGTEMQHRRFTTKLALNGLGEWPTPPAAARA